MINGSYNDTACNIVAACVSVTSPPVAGDLHLSTNEISGFKAIDQSQAWK